jgi:hypothetical protein
MGEPEPCGAVVSFSKGLHQRWHVIGVFPLPGTHCR